MMTLLIAVVNVFNHDKFPSRIVIGKKPVDEPNNDDEFVMLINP